MAIKTTSTVTLLLPWIHSSNRIYTPNLSIRTLSLWSMKKEPDLESSLSRNRRWIINNQLKNIILRCPNQIAPVHFIQKKFKTLDLQGKALNWLKKYPCCFEIFLENSQHHCRLTKRMLSLVEEEDIIKENQEPILVEKLTKLLMLSSNRKINVMKFNELKRNFGFPDDYLIRIIPKYPEKFRLVNYSGKRSSMDIELVDWNIDLAISVIEIKACEKKIDPCFDCLLPLSWEKSWERFRLFNDESPYVSPYIDVGCLGEKEVEKRNVGLIHELLSLTLWKKASIVKLGHFRREFALPEKLGVFLLRHPGIFYVSNRYQIHTVVLRDGYAGSELIDKDPLVVVKEKFGELMQEGLHEYNRRRYAVNLEKKKKKHGLVAMGLKDEGRRKASGMLGRDNCGGERGDDDKPEERRRYLRAFLEDDNQ